MISYRRHFNNKICGCNPGSLSYHIAFTDGLGVQLFYSLQILVCCWFLAKNKTAAVSKSSLSIPANLVYFFTVSLPTQTSRKLLLLITTSGEHEELANTKTSNVFPDLSLLSKLLSLQPLHQAITSVPFCMVSFLLNQFFQLEAVILSNRI